MTTDTKSHLTFFRARHVRFLLFGAFSFPCLYELRPSPTLSAVSLLGLPQALYDLAELLFSSTRPLNVRVPEPGVFIVINKAPRQQPDSPL